MSALFGIQAMQFQTFLRSSLAGGGDELRILNDLRLSIDQIYLSMKAPHMQVPQAEFDYSEFRNDPVWGQMYEIKTLLPLNCSYSQLNYHVCNHITPYKNQQGEWFTQVRSLRFYLSQAVVIVLIGFLNDLLAFYWSRCRASASSAFRSNS
jgi:hypothetical protein